MTVTEAYQILELSPGAEMGEIKKKYRHLMHRMHPDVYFSSGEQPSHPAQELNLAYAVLKKSWLGKRILLPARSEMLPLPSEKDGILPGRNTGMRR